MPFSSYPQEEFMRVAELSGILEQLQESFISARIHQIYQLSAESYEWVFRKKGKPFDSIFRWFPNFPGFTSSPAL
jgi:predicted ribosome quality control (RQC) complex YloA/Tae2 family protein